MQFLHSIDMCCLACCSFRASQSIHVCCVAAQSSCVEAHAAVWAHCTAKHKGRATQRAQAHAAVFARSTVSPDFQCTRAVAHFSSLCLRFSDAPDYTVLWTVKCMYNHMLHIILYNPVHMQHGTLLIKLPQMPQIILVTPPALTNAKNAC